jgi:hypothetical protein
MKTVDPRTKTSKLLTLSGKWLDVLNPHVDAIDIQDIAMGLAQTNRYNGQLPRPYSVAQHSVLCARVAPPDLKFDALMHDATEAYVGDLCRPVKQQICKFREVEDQLEAVIRRKFGLCGEKHGVFVKEIDVRMLVTEAKQFGLEWWDWWGVEPYDLVIDPWDWEEARREFLKAFVQLAR